MTDVKERARTVWPFAASRPNGLSNGLAACGAPAAENEAADSEPEPERAERERPDRDKPAPERQAVPAADRLLLVGREGLTATLFPRCPSGTKAEVDVVEELWRLVRHDASV